MPDLKFAPFPDDKLSMFEWKNEYAVNTFSRILDRLVQYTVVKLILEIPERDIRAIRRVIRAGAQ